MIDKERLEKILNNNHKCFGTENLVLNSKLVKELNLIIKKLSDEVDALTKQKEYLQKQLRKKDEPATVKADEVEKEKAQDNSLENEVNKTSDGRELI